MLLLRKPVLCILALALSACSGVAGAPPAPGPATPVQGSHHKIAARITLTIPRRHKRGKHARYISPSTKSMSIDIKQNATTVYARTFNVTPSSAGCAAVNSGTQCTISVSLAAGSYTATVGMYSGTFATGDVLSQGQNIAFTVKAAQDNDVQLVLNGIPHALTIAGADNDVYGSAEGFTLFGTSARKVIVTATDATGNLIVGPGAPTYSTTLADGGGWTIGSTTAANPNAFSITPPGTKNSRAHVSVTANFSDDTCTQPGAVCTLNFPIDNDVQYLYVGYIPGPESGADSVIKFAL
ncbi:MAG TPA: hypothetical protein VK760_15755, partial [Candidatus Acidoferrales bacterium]|nr:hypothetical protein [Candidatus Acidoferrales bacterium]